MRKRILVSAVLTVVILLCGCSHNKADNSSNILSESKEMIDANASKLPQAILNNMTEEEGYYDIQAEEEPLSVYLAKDEFELGAYYEEGEPVWLIGNESGNVYSYRLGQEKKLLLEGMSSTYVSEYAQWWRGEDKYFVVFGRFLHVFYEDGAKACQVILGEDDRIYDICQTTNGIAAVVLDNGENYTTNLMELNTQTGEMISKLALQEHYGIAGGAGDSVKICDGDGIYTYHMESGERVWHMKWGGTTYDPNADDNSTIDFVVTENGNVRLLTKDIIDEKWYEETLTKISFDEIDKTLLVYRTLYASSQLKSLIAQYNKENKEYYIYLEERDSATAAQDFYEKTAIEIATGKGPDIIDAYSVEDIYAMAQKGVLEDLEPYIQANDINKEDYFAAAFCDFDTEGHCYGLGFALSLRTMYIKEELAKGVTSLETLLKNINAYEGEAVFNTLYDYYPTTLLHYFLYMSEDFYGMLDWEAGTCDFNNELWYSMLEAAQKYGLDERKTGLEDIATPVLGQTLKSFLRDDFSARSNGMISLGYPSEETMMHSLQVSSICMNAASGHKEGVWEFMQFLLREQSQQKIAEMYLPVSKEVFEKEYQNALDNPGYITLMDGTVVEAEAKQIELCAKLLEQAQPLPVKTEYVWTIIKEETVSYFSGEKTKEQVTEIIENRISMYMAENM